MSWTVTPWVTCTSRPSSRQHVLTLCPLRSRLPTAIDPLLIDQLKRNCSRVFGARLVFPEAVLPPCLRPGVQDRLPEHRPAMSRQQNATFGSETSSEADGQNFNIVAECMACSTLLLRYLLCLGPRPARWVTLCCTHTGPERCRTCTCQVASCASIAGRASLSKTLSFGQQVAVGGDSRLVSSAESQRQQRESLRPGRGLGNLSQKPAAGGPASAEGKGPHIR